MEIFAPKSENPEKSTDSEPLFQNFFPPFGFNRQTPSSESFQDLPSKGTDLAQSVAKLFSPSKKEAIEDPRHPLMPVGSDDTSSNARNWAGIAKDVMGLLGVNPPTTTTTTTPSPVVAGLQMFNPKFYQQVSFLDKIVRKNRFRKPVKNSSLVFMTAQIDNRSLSSIFIFHF